jgi:AcrR family transcriptional regulator
MDEQVIDLRIQRTYQFLSDALFELLLKKPFHQITVTDICKKAMVHRTTFYKHFEDKYQLLGMMFSDEKKNFELIQMQEGESEKDYYGRIIRHMFEYASRYKEFFIQSIIRSKDDFIMQLLRTTISSYLQQCYSLAEQQSGSNNIVPIPIMSEYYAGGAVALTVWWLENDMQIPIDEMVNYMIQLIAW